MSVPVSMRNIHKVFPGVAANKGINFDVERGQVHALLGENGAGKTTLMNILYGLYHPDEGQIYMHGKLANFSSPADAIRYGIGMVHQHFMLVPAFSVAENVILGQVSWRKPMLDMRAAVREVARLSEAYGLLVDPTARVSQLSVGMQQRVEIIKCLYREASILIMDEPTAVLTPGEAKDLFRVFRALTDKGLSIVFISHKLNEVIEISDRITVLRNGQVVGSVNKSDTTTSELVAMMVGRELTSSFRRTQITPGEAEIVLEVRDLSANDDRGLPALKGLSFSVKRGEILGLAGVDGNGQRELAEVIYGLRKTSSGKAFILGHATSQSGAWHILNEKVGYIPEDRHREGTVPSFSIAENLIVKTASKRPFARHGLLDSSAIYAHAMRMIKQYDVRTPGVETKVSSLSGGNQQKVVLARELDRKPDLLIAVQPTRGLDIGATEYVQTQILEHRNRGAAVLYISMELDEVLTMSDRVMVLFGGEIMGILPADKVDYQEIGHMMAGSRRAAHMPEGES